MIYLSEHQELSHQIQEATDPSLREDLERENERLLTRMEIKAEQIARLRKHKDTVSFIIHNKLGLRSVLFLMHSFCTRMWLL